MILIRTIRMRIPTSKFALTLLVTIVILVATILLTWFFERCGLNVQDQVRSVQSMKDYVGWNWFFIKLVAMVVVVSPVVEELIFRFPTRLVKHTIFAVVISILFVILHAVPKVMATHDLMYFVEINSATFPLFFMALVWCWLYRRTGRIWCTMLSHSLFNIVNFTLALVFT